jgi:hypothetical protein
VALSTRGEARARDYEDEVETVEDARSRLLDRAESVERSLDELVDRARTAYDDMQPELAMSALEYAIKLGLSIEYRGRKLGQVYLLQGLVIHASKQTEDYEEQTRSAFIRALSYDRDIRLSYQDSVPRLEQIFDAAIEQLTQLGRAGGLLQVPKQGGAAAVEGCELQLCRCGAAGRDRAAAGRGARPAPQPVAAQGLKALLAQHCQAGVIEG